MSAKQERTVRVGCGRYHWFFRAQRPRLAQRLGITIEAMEVLPPDSLSAVMAWVEALPYPWCPVQFAAERMPALEGLGPIRAWLAAR